MKVLMIGPARSVKGGISAVVNNYYRLGLDNMVELQYLATRKNSCSNWWSITMHYCANSIICNKVIGMLS